MYAPNEMSRDEREELGTEVGAEAHKSWGDKLPPRKKLPEREPKLDMAIPPKTFAGLIE